MEQTYSFDKSERLCSKILIDRLFKEGSRSFSAYPIRVVFQCVERSNAAPVAVLMSVAKRRFKRAVKRNRVKRQLRESYRQHKQIVWRAMQESHAEDEVHLAIAFIWLSDQQCDSKKVEKKMVSLLHRIAETLHDDLEKRVLPKEVLDDITSGAVATNPLDSSLHD